MTQKLTSLGPAVSTETSLKGGSSGDGGMAAFAELFDVLVKQVMDTVPASMPQVGKDWLKQNMDYNIPGGKMNRGIMVSTTLAALLKRPLTEAEALKAHVLGWCVEWLQAFFLVADDVMDNSKTRRGQPCWFRQSHVGLIAINDAMLLESAIFKLLKIYFKSDVYYADLLELFHETIYQTELGQLMDLITAPEDSVDLDRFSLEKYNWIVEYKTAYYSFHLPVALAMHMYGTTDPKAFDLAQSILIPLGRYFQVQDDYLDCYGDPKYIGKIGTDIQDNKCSWLINKALTLVTPEQRAVLDEAYGKKDDASVARVKAVFTAVNVQGAYRDFEETSYKALMGLVEGADESLLPKEVFIKFIARIYKRDK